MRLQEKEAQQEIEFTQEIGGLIKGEHKVSQLLTKIEILTAKNHSLQKKFEHKALIVKNIEDNASLNEKQRLDLEQQNDTLTSDTIELKHEITSLKTKLQNCISK